jgi:soluble lytic murein transglycosylase-like protein
MFLKRIILTVVAVCLVMGLMVRGANDGAGRALSFKTIGTVYSDVIMAASNTYNLPASLIAAIIKVESNFDPKAMSERGAIGLMQLSFSTRKAMNVTNPFDPVQNILAGARYLRGLLDQFDGNVDMAVAAYNAGPEAVERHNGIPPFGQTRAFVPKVMRYYSAYESGVAVD